MKLSTFLAAALREAVDTGRWRRYRRIDFWPLAFVNKAGKRFLGILRVEMSVHSIREHPNQEAPPEEPPKSIDL